uniref:DUF7054 domain-containing protein n=1 Tax=Kalanchoe fedtschenkoi TaxID=63787 RepID=A0A7N0ZTN4_KALFE
MLIPKMKKNQNQKGEEQNRILITVNVVGSAGPIRFIVNKDDAVTDVVATALKIYAHQGRLPVLGSDSKDFLLFCAAAGSDFLDSSERIGSCEARNFLLCKNPQPQLKTTVAEDVKKDKKVAGKAFKTWINKSLRVGVSAH